MVKKLLHYVGLSLAVSIGVLIALQLSEPVSKLITSYLTTDLSAEKITKSESQAPMNMEQIFAEFEKDEKRSLSDKGQQLQISCDAWTSAYQSQQNTRSKELMIEYCLRKQTFIREGRDLAPAIFQDRYQSAEIIREPESESEAANYIKGVLYLSDQNFSQKPEWLERKESKTGKEMELVCNTWLTEYTTTRSVRAHELAYENCIKLQKYIFGGPVRTAKSTHNKK